MTILPDLACQRKLKSRTTPFSRVEAEVAGQEVAKEVRVILKVMILEMTSDAKRLLLREPHLDALSGLEISLETTQIRRSISLT